MTATRQLAAIMFTDIVGYTRLMGEDEQKAMQVLRKNRKIHQSIIKKYQSKWLKEMGDGTLALAGRIYNSESIIQNRQYKKRERNWIYVLSYTEKRKTSFVNYSIIT